MRCFNTQNISYETERLIIRFVGEEDYEEFVAAFKRCGPAKNRFDEQFDTKFMTRTWFRKLLKRREKEVARDYAYKFDIFRKEDGIIIGYCDISPHYREDFQYASIGYAILNPFWGNGYATETVSALSEIGFNELNLHRLEAHVNLDNPASKRVLQKAGFKFECVREAFILEDGIWTDNEIYYMNNENWKAPDLA